MNDAGWNSILSLNAPTMPLSIGSIRIRNCSAPSFTRSSASVMLPLVSSMTTTVIGVGSLSKLVIVCGLALS